VLQPVNNHALAIMAPAIARASISLREVAQNMPGYRLSSDTRKINSVRARISIALN
jgi:hypothetical protein